MVRKVRTRRCAHKGVGGSSVRKSDDIDDERVLYIYFHPSPSNRLGNAIEAVATYLVATLRRSYRGWSRVRSVGPEEAAAAEGGEEQRRDTRRGASRRHVQHPHDRPSDAQPSCTPGPTASASASASA